MGAVIRLAEVLALDGAWGKVHVALDNLVDVCLGYGVSVDGSYCVPVRRHLCWYGE